MAYRSIILTLILMACSRDAYMTLEGFDAVHTGMTVAELEACVGKPWSTCAGDRSGVDLYQYIERIEGRPDYPEHLHYFIEVEDGKVISKAYERVDPPRLQSID